MKRLLKTSIGFSLFVLSLGVLVVANYHVWKQDQVYEQEIRDLQQQLSLQQQENEKIADINDRLKQKIESLKLGSYEMIEEEARTGFGMVGEDETFFHFKQPDSDEPPQK